MRGPGVVAGTWCEPFVPQKGELSDSRSGAAFPRVPALEWLVPSGVSLLAQNCGGSVPPVPVSALPCLGGVPLGIEKANPVEYQSAGLPGAILAQSRVLLVEKVCRAAATAER